MESLVSVLGGNLKMDSDPELMKDDAEMEGFDVEDEFDEELYFDDGAYEADASAAEAIENVIDDMLQVASVEAAYGAPIQHGDTVVIPAAEVTAVMGFGMGMGRGADAKGESEGAGSGGGGGGTSFSRPVAVIVSGPEGVRIEPVFDLTKIALAALSAGVFVLGMFSRVQNTRRAYKTIERELRG
jgi:uncharacterized spore protein YtfJ